MVFALVYLVLVQINVDVAKLLRAGDTGYKTDKLILVEGVIVVLVELIEPRGELCKVVSALAVHVLEDLAHELFRFFYLKEAIIVDVVFVPDKFDGFLD